MSTDAADDLTSADHALAEAAAELDRILLLRAAALDASILEQGERLEDFADVRQAFHAALWESRQDALQRIESAFAGARARQLRASRLLLAKYSHLRTLGT